MKYEMGLKDKYFQLVKNEKKKIELRLLDSKRQQLKIGDILTFYKDSNQTEKIDTIITNLYKYQDFSQAIKDLGLNLITDEAIDKCLNDLETFYPREKQDKYGVVAIEIDKVKNKEKSCGIVVTKEENKKQLVLLIHHNLGHWGIPKGHVEKGETEEETALREVLEETGIRAEIVSDFRKVVTYSPKKNTIKDVIFYLGKPLDNHLKPQLEEVQQVEWIELDKAVDIITYKDEKEILKSVIKELEKK